MIDQQLLHRRAAQAAIALVCVTLVLVVGARLTGVAARYEPKGATLASIELLFTDEPDGVVAVFDAADGSRLLEYGENEGVFVRAVMRSVARQRRMRGLGPETPVRLARLEDDALWLIDPASGAQFYLGAFGPDNEAAFAAMLERDGPIRTARVEGGRS